MVLGIDDAECVSLLRDASRAADTCETCTDDAYESLGLGDSDDTCFGAGLEHDSAQTHMHCDEDWVFFEVLGGATYEIQTEALAGGADTLIELYRDCTTLLDFDDDGGDGQGSSVTFTTAGSDDTLDLRISESNDSYGDGKRYDVRVSCTANCCERVPDRTLADDTILTTQVIEGCKITVGPNWAVDGSGKVTLRATSQVIFLDEVRIGYEAELTIETN